MDNFFSFQNVSRETSLNLEKYLELILKWNTKINLVSKKSNRELLLNEHLLDCLQLQSYINNKNSTIIDVGSGAGFPGMVLAILGYTKCKMVEIITKKCTFLKTVILELNLPNTVINNDIKKVFEKPEYIVSRAVTSVGDLINLCTHMISKETTIILLKSKKQKDELKEVSKNWNYELQEFQNIYKTEGVILVIKNLSPKWNKA